MVITGVALLAVCALAGLLMGELLGDLLGVDANAGGVGFAMIFLILSTSWLMRRGMLSPPGQRGIEFWSSIYIPIVVGMAMQQNVAGAISGGPLAVLAGVAAVALGFALVPVIAGRPPVPPTSAEPTAATARQSTPDQTTEPVGAERA
jgi:malonate transporter MadL subunit